MTLKLDIPKDMEADLLTAAQANGISPEAYASQVLRDQIRAGEKAQNAVPMRPASRKSLAQLFAESPLKGLNLDFERDPDTGRSVDL